MDVFDLPAKPCGIVHLVLEEDSSHVILSKVFGVMQVVNLHQKEFLHLGWIEIRSPSAGHKSQGGPRWVFDVFGGGRSKLGVDSSDESGESL